MHTATLLALTLAAALPAVESPYPWAQPQAEVSASGDLAWAPRPYRAEIGPSPRYIDFAGGDDAADGLTPATAWKHHPWDAAATGTAKACTGVHSYLFKGGVTYRGVLTVAESGTATEPIRLLRAQGWGEGPAVLVGSERITAWKRAAPAGAPTGNVIWSATLDFLPRKVWAVADDGTATDLPLARTPNWRADNLDDIKAGWWQWQMRGKGLRHFGNKRSISGWKQELSFANDPDHLTPELLAQAKGAYVWSEYGWVMGTPFPSLVREVFPAEHGLVLGGQWGDGAGSEIIRGNRYYLENKAAFLDDPRGEHWFERKGEGGTLFVILPQGQTPETVAIEAARHNVLIRAGDVAHLRISDLDFRFTNMHWNLDALGGEELISSAIRQSGTASDLVVEHCRFSDLGGALSMTAGGGARIDGLRFSDNLIERADQAGVVLHNGWPWGQPDAEIGVIDRIEILRNRLHDIGLRPSRPGQGHALHVECGLRVQVAGNILSRCGAAGIFVFGGKPGMSTTDVPFVRLLIHHNKVTDALLNSNDWGGIETWQGGPAYVFNNISGGIRGYWNYQIANPSGGDNSNASFGHAYYLDGAFKNYHFNNIAYGRSRDWNGTLWTCSGFQEIHSYQNTFFHNTVYDVNAGSRRQAPGAGRNQYLGNIFDGVQTAFRHADGAKAEANARDAGDQGDHFAYDTNAYGSNVFGEVQKFGLFEEGGVTRDTLDAFATALDQRQALRADLGIAADQSPLPKGADRDFTPTAIADGRGVTVFVPWALAACVGEWHFRPMRTDGRILDEHWDMPPYFHGRTSYHDQPTFPLIPAVKPTAEAQVACPLEDWTAGALVLDGKDQWLRVADADLDAPVTYVVHHRAGPKRGQKEERQAQGPEARNPEIHTSDLLLEVYARFDGTDGLILGKRDAQAGYALDLVGGKLRFALRYGGADTAVTTPGTFSDGAWHHVIAEADRNAATLRLYVDGKQVAEGKGLGPVSLANGVDLGVGGTATGERLAMAIDFLRVCQTTLAASGTSIDELRAWQFDGPQFRDFSGQEPRGAGRDAGAIER